MGDEPEGDAGPLGDGGLDTGRDRLGRFTPGNTAALVTGRQSLQVWRGQEDARRAIVAALLDDAGHDLETAPTALRMAAEAAAEAKMIQASAFCRLTELGSAQTTKDRARRCYVVWRESTAVLERFLRYVTIASSPEAKVKREVAGLSVADLKALERDALARLATTANDAPLDPRFVLPTDDDGDGGEPR
jgi:hypothetical protein